ncbi:Cysteine-rich protein 2 [Varanus komodoensis]|nr:Cysteine-rich protein 2 [Varanus komodoensis]
MRCLEYNYSYLFPLLTAERKRSLGKDYHPLCLKCYHCKRQLSPGQHAEGEHDGPKSYKKWDQKEIKHPVLWHNDSQRLFPLNLMTSPTAPIAICSALDQEVSVCSITHCSAVAEVCPQGKRMGEEPPSLADNGLSADAVILAASDFINDATGKLRLQQFHLICGIPIAIMQRERCCSLRVDRLQAFGLMCTKCVGMRPSTTRSSFGGSPSKVPAEIRKSS